MARGRYNSRQKGKNLTMHDNSFCLISVVRNRMTVWSLIKRNGTCGDNMGMKKIGLQRVMDHDLVQAIIC